MTVSLVGIPGSGKTTLCRRLATELGFQAFVLGDALRQRSIVDAELRASLDRGELAPEPLVLELVRATANNAKRQGLVLDGFPRHPGQLAFATSLFDSWNILWLDIDIDTAASRLLLRRTCGNCWNTSSIVSDDTVCSHCGARDWKRRGEDESETLLPRLKRFRVMLNSMLGAMQGVPVHRIDATQSVSSVIEQALATLRE